MISRSRHSAFSPQELAKKWHITQKQAEATFAATTQYGVRYSRNPLIRRYRTDTAVLSYKHFKDTTSYSDTMHSKVVLLKGFKYLKVFCNEDFAFVVPIKKKLDAGSALKILIQQVGVPSCIVVDVSLEQTADNSEFMCRAKQYDIQICTTEWYTPRQNRAENVIGILRHKWHIMAHRSVPPRLWDFGYIYQAEIHSRTARGPGSYGALQLLAHLILKLTDLSDDVRLILLHLCHMLHCCSCQNTAASFQNPITQIATFELCNAEPMSQTRVVIVARFCQFQTKS
jgi:hypothetical protein